MAVVSLGFEKKLLFVLMLFYPMIKAVFSMLIWFIFSVDISSIFRYTYFPLIIILLIVVFVNEKVLTFPSNKKLLLFFATIFGVASVVHSDLLSLKLVIMLFLFPILLGWTVKLSDKFVVTVFSWFFKLTIVYLMVEFLIIDLQLLEEFSREEHNQYYALLSSSTEINVGYMKLGELLLHRTGGYLSNVLVMPVLLSFSTIYYYICFWRHKKVVDFIMLACGIFLTLFSFSLTGLFVTIISMLVYNIFVARLYVTTLLLTGLIFLLFIYGYVENMFVVKRAIVNIFSDTRSSTAYVDIFTTFNINLENVFRIILGRISNSNSPFPSHIEYFNVLSLVGLFVFGYIFWKWFIMIRYGLSEKHSPLLIYGMTMLVSILGFIHHHSGLTPYPFLFFTVSFVKLDSYFTQKKYYYKLITSVPKNN
jgi:hypothetical protein